MLNRPGRPSLEETKKTRGAIKGTDKRARFAVSVEIDMGLLPPVFCLKHGGFHVRSRMRMRL
jgi:hypothetical protein